MKERGGGNARALSEFWRKKVNKKMSGPRLFFFALSHFSTQSSAFKEKKAGVPKGCICPSALKR